VLDHPIGIDDSEAFVTKAAHDRSAPLTISDLTPGKP